MDDEGGGKGKLRILVVDDVPGVSQAIAFGLRRLGFQTQEASTPDEVLRAIEQEKPDAVLLDVHLAAGVTFALADQIRGDRRCKETAIVAITGYDNEATRCEALRHCNGFVAKPFRTTVLKEEILSAITRQRELARNC